MDSNVLIFTGVCYSIVCTVFFVNVCKVNEENRHLRFLVFLAVSCILSVIFIIALNKITISEKVGLIAYIIYLVCFNRAMRVASEIDYSMLYSYRNAPWLKKLDIEKTYSYLIGALNTYSGLSECYKRELDRLLYNCKSYDTLSEKVKYIYLSEGTLLTLLELDQKKGILNKIGKKGKVVEVKRNERNRIILVV